MSGSQSGPCHISPVASEEKECEFVKVSGLGVKKGGHPEGEKGGRSCFTQYNYNGTVFMALVLLFKYLIVGCAIFMSNEEPILVVSVHTDIYRVQKVHREIPKLRISTCVFTSL